MKQQLIERATWELVAWFGIAIALSIAASFYISWAGVVIVFALLAIFIAVVARPVWGVYALAAAAPLSGLAISFASEQSLSRVPYLGGIEAPVVDFIAIILLVAAPIIFFINHKKIFPAHIKNHLPWFLLWFAAVAAAVYFGDPIYFGTSLKAFFRPYLFTYLAFVLPILLFVNRRAEIIYAAVAYEIACLAGALMGAVSIFVTSSIGFPRAEPFAIFGYIPFGTNHNVLAESLTAIIPFAVWWASEQKTRAAKIFWGGAAALIAIVSALTFSRAAWIVLALQGLGWLWFFGKHTGRRRVAIVAVVAVVALFFMWIENTAVADSSNATRTDLTGIALTYFNRAPLTGQGPGTFIQLVGETAAFRLDYGDPLDAHGFLQKVMAETGALGTIAFLALLISLGWRLWKRRHSAFEAVWFFTFISLWAYQLFNTGYFDGKVWVLVGLCLASLL